MPPTIALILDKTVNETDNLTLPCVATGVPLPFVSWVKVSSEQRTNGSLLQLTNISRSQAGEYRCEASNECGNAVETVNITVPCKLQRCHSCHGILTIVKISVFQEEREMSLRTHKFLWLEKTADFSRRLHWFSREMTS